MKNEKNVKYEVFYNMYWHEYIPTETMTDEEKEAFVEYAKVREVAIQKYREELIKDYPNLTEAEIDKLLKEDIADGALEESTIEILYKIYPDLEKYMEDKLWED